MSKKLRQLQDRAAAILREQTAISVEVDKEERGENQFVMSEEEQVKFDALSKEFDTVEAAIGREKLLAERTKTLENQAETPEERPAARIEPVNDPNQSGPFKSFGEQLQAVAQAKTGGRYDERLDQLQMATGHAAGVPSDGGVMIQREFVSEIMRRTYDQAILAGACRRYTPGAGKDGVEFPYMDETSRGTGSRLGGVRVYWTDEATAATASKTKLGKFKLDLEELRALTYATERLLEDAPMMEQLYKDVISEEFAFAIDDAIIRGTGVGQIQGLLNSACLVSTAKESGQAADSVVYANIQKMWGNLWTRSRASAVWYINQELEEQLNNMTMVVGTGGVPVYLPPGGATESPYGRLYGRPVIPLEQCSAPGDVGDIILADMNEFLLIEKGGLKSDSSMHVKFIEHEMTFRFQMRINGKTLWPAALTPYKGSSGKTYSPFVTLAAR